MRNVILAACCTAVLLGTGLALAAGDRMPSFVAAAVVDPGRPAEDKERDAQRKPAETVEFAGIKPGDKVLELVPSRGYFTRIFSKAVGPKGHVYAQSPPRRPNAAADSPDPVAATAAIAANPDYANVTASAASLVKVTAPEPVDVVFTAQNYHDVHNVQNVDVVAFNKSVFDALKPGGLYVIVDHAAAAGSGARDTSTLHRIDPETVKTEVLAAGFKFVGASTALHNTQDDHTQKVFDPVIRGKTDQFIFKFRKPGKS